jgi:rhamnosyltransferase
MKDSLCVVLVSYNPTEHLLKNIDALIPQVAEILIVDNGSSSDSLYILEQLSKKKSVKVEYNSNNLGIATALNQGVKYASKHGYEWVATFDQDSLAPANYIQTMLETYHSYNDLFCNKLVAIVAPRYQTDTGEIYFSKEKDNELNFSTIKTTITSGNLVRVAAFEKVGLFDNSYFIDYVDHEFCLRVRSKGWSIVESHRSLLLHSLGNSTLHKIGGFRIVTTGHSPIRRYYKYRNLIRTLKRYYWFEPWMLIKDLKCLFFEPLKILLFEKDKFSKLGSIYKGVFDGTIGT